MRMQIYTGWLMSTLPIQAKMTMINNYDSNYYYNIYNYNNYYLIIKLINIIIIITIITIIIIMFKIIKI